MDRQLWIDESRDSGFCKNTQTVAIHENYTEQNKNIIIFIVFYKFIYLKKCFRHLHYCFKCLGLVTFLMFLKKVSSAH